jgi:hypothetical protein
LEIRSKEVRAQQICPIQICSSPATAGEINFEEIGVNEVGYSTWILSAPCIPLVNTPVTQKRNISRVRHILP